MWGETSRKDVKGGWGEEEKEPGSNELDATRYGSGPKRIIIITSLQPIRTRSRTNNPYISPKSFFDEPRESNLYQNNINFVHEMDVATGRETTRITCRQLRMVEVPQRRFLPEIVTEIGVDMSLLGPNSLCIAFPCAYRVAVSCY